jgi:hypothetical protein
LNDGYKCALNLISAVSLSWAERQVYTSR